MNSTFRPSKLTCNFEIGDDYGRENVQMPTLSMEHRSRLNVDLKQYRGLYKADLLSGLCFSMKDYTTWSKLYTVHVIAVVYVVMLAVVWDTAANFWPTSADNNVCYLCFIFTLADNLCIKPTGLWTSWTSCNGANTRVQSRVLQLDVFQSPGWCKHYSLTDIAEVKMCRSKKGTY